MNAGSDLLPVNVSSFSELLYRNSFGRRKIPSKEHLIADHIDHLHDAIWQLLWRWPGVVKGTAIMAIMGLVALIAWGDGLD